MEIINEDNLDKVYSHNFQEAVKLINLKYTHYQIF